MDSAQNVEFLVQTEPWRAGQGRPRNMLDPIWASDTLVRCESTVDQMQWEAESGWWWCRKCGHCSNLHYMVHYVVESPKAYHELSLQQFFARRETQGFPYTDAHDQALHIAGVALRVAASKRPEEFAKLVDDILELAD